MTELFFTLISAALINNLVLHLPLGIDPLLRLPEDADRARIHALGIATCALMTFSAVPGKLLADYLLAPLDLGFLRLFVFLPLCVLLIGPLLRLLARALPGLPFAGLDNLLLANAAILGLSLIADDAQVSALTTLMLSLGAGLGFWLVLSLFDDLRQRVCNDDVPSPFRGLPIQLISAGLMAMAFLGFDGLFKS
ncbi:Rnf-Nqr domain containing protein [Pseudomonas sp. R5(2019)]|uniref:Rnf-Nqr domain containing protein n=1 Tax=Pseudomonas sp. R5(2019) TaxID=2697566 RepID=UPI001411BA7C|nr:Rnf-Nqr domain containing protein [Pseudomonas sp. R5(2019)]NBA94588.1 NADH:quinone oxidoreductase [Pseudomonas sp. R5(2019)]